MTQVQSQIAPTAPLLVDLDRDLLHGNLTAESAWALIRSGFGPRGTGIAVRLSLAVTVLLALFGLASRAGRAKLASRAPLDLSHLPFDPELRAACVAAQALGRETVLLTQGDQALADGVAAELGGFDRALGGAAARAFDGSTASPPPPAPRGAILPEAVRQIRPHQWVKNVLVFLPLIAAHAFDAASLSRSLIAFVAFSLIASGVYVLNDLADLASDRRHRTKRNRPFASGRLPVRYGIWMLAGLVGAGLALALTVNPLLAVVLLGYYLLTTAYSMKLKGLLGADIMVLAMLYTMRIIAGAAANGIVPSMWLLTFSIFLFLSLAAVKRLAELVDLEAQPGRTAATGRAYTVEDRPIIAMIATSAGFLSVLVFALYLDSPEVWTQYGQPMVLWGICLVQLFWISRVVLLAHRGLVNQDPVVFALTDRVSRVSGVVMALMFVAALFA